MLHSSSFRLPLILPLHFIVVQTTAAAASQPIQHVMLILSGASHIDTTAVEAVKEWRQAYDQSGISLALVDPSPPIVTILHRSGCLNTGELLCAILPQVTSGLAPWLVTESSFMWCTKSVI